MLLGSPPSKLLEFDGPAAWIFDLSLLGFLGRRSGGGEPSSIANSPTASP
ncbi:MAG: hypothetical protein J7K49_04410 [Thaumarchaeota archaeon]|nr:hypothetical protein [Nitrososphaerota archaeon]